MVTTRVPPDELRWRCTEKAVSAPGAKADPWRELRRALRARLEHALVADRGRGAHVFIRTGNPRIGSMVLTSALARIQRSPEPADTCFVHNFDDPTRPRRIRVPAGHGHRLRTALGEIGRFVRDELDTALDARPIRNRLQAIDERVGADMDRMSAPVEEQLKPHGLVLVREETGQIVRLTIHVRQTGRVITQDDFANLVARGQVSREEFEKIRRIVRDLQPEVRALTARINESWRRARALRRRLLRAETRRLIVHLAEPLLASFDSEAVRRHLDAIIDDVLNTRGDRPAPPAADPELLYGANLVAAAESDAIPSVLETVPSRRNLAGTIDTAGPDPARPPAPFQGIRAGSLVGAGAGFLVIHAGDLLARPRSVALLENALRHGELVIQSRFDGGAPAVSLRPDPLPVDCRLVVIGTPADWNRLARRHAGFCRLFEQPLDVAAAVTRDRAGIGWLCAELRRRCASEGLHEPDAGALALLVEDAARRGGPGRLDADTGVVMRRIREAARNVADDPSRQIGPDDLVAAAERLSPIEAVRPPGFRFPNRQERPGRSHACLVARDGVRARAVLVQLQAVSAPDAAFSLQFDGIEAGADERRLATRLAVVLARLLRLDRPLGLRVIIDVAGVPDDWTAGGAAALVPAVAAALVSELADAPLRQDLALFGRLHPDGRIGRAEAINECIEAAWRASGTDGGEPGVIMPAAQRDALMLDPELAQAAGNDLVRVLGAGNLDQALELMTGAGPGAWRDGAFPDDSIYARARRKLTGG